jgi:hypothetical protein
LNKLKKNRIIIWEIIKISGETKKIMLIFLLETRKLKFYWQKTGN